jgi:tetratricopeptide (TPR) repeat protein
MSELKPHTPTATDLAADDADRRESGAGIVVIILACLVVLGLVAGGGVVGFVVYRGFVMQLQEERARLMAQAEMERAMAEMSAVKARQAAEAVQAAKRADGIAEAQAKLRDFAVAPSPEENPPAQGPQPTPDERFAAEIEPLNQAVAERPDDPQVWRDRARVYQRWQKWKEAAEDYERFLESHPKSGWVLQDAALMRFANGDREAYLAHCKAIEEVLATKTQATNEHNRAARILCLAPGALTSGERLLVQAQDEPLKNPGRWWLVEPMVALQYRTGRYDEALKTIDEARPLAGFSGQRAATEIWAAMTLQQLGRHEDARAALAAAEQHVAGGLPPPGGANAGGDAVIIARYLMDEARALIEGGQPATPPAE